MNADDLKSFRDDNERWHFYELLEWARCYPSHAGEEGFGVEILRPDLAMLYLVITNDRRGARLALTQDYPALAEQLGYVRRS